MSLSLGPAGIVGGASECTALSPPVLLDWAVFLGGTKSGLVWGQFGDFQTYKLYRLIG